jgi:hypothetical protein
VPIAQVADAAGIAQHRLVAGSLAPLGTVGRLAVATGPLALCWGVLAAALTADLLDLAVDCLLNTSMVVQDGTVSTACFSR